MRENSEYIYSFAERDRDEVLKLIQLAEQFFPLVCSHQRVNNQVHRLMMSKVTSLLAFLLGLCGCVHGGLVKRLSSLTNWPRLRLILILSP